MKYLLIVVIVISVHLAIAQTSEIEWPECDEDRVTWHPHPYACTRYKSEIIFFENLAKFNLLDTCCASMETLSRGFAPQACISIVSTNSACSRNLPCVI